jgi:hypothetical protein
MEQGLVAGAVLAFPGARVDWIILPFLAAAYEKHDEAEDEHDGSPSEIEVDAHGFFVDVRGVAGEEAVEAHEATDEEEDEAEGDADVESHLVVRSQLSVLSFLLRSVASFD